MSHSENCVCLDCKPDQEKPHGEYVCCICGMRYAKGWSDEEANAEYEDNFGHKKEDATVELSVCCDDCYNGAMDNGMREFIEIGKQMRTMGKDE